MTRCLPIRTVSSAWPSTLLILCEPVWARSSRLSRMRAPPARSVSRLASVIGVGRPGVAGEQAVELGDERRIAPGRGVLGVQLVEGLDQRLGDEPAAVGPEVAGLVRDGRARQGVAPARSSGGLHAARSAPAATSSATVACGSAPLTQASPASTASAPAAAYSATSAGPRTPDSATASAPAGTSGRSRAKTARSTCSVCRLRALTPISWAPMAAARSSSSSSWTSTSGHHAVLADLGVQVGQQRLLERGDDQQHQIGAVRPGFGHLVRRDDEVLAQQRNVDGGPDRIEVGERTAEAPLLGEHADRRRAARRRRPRPARPGRRSSPARPCSGSGA